MQLGQVPAEGTEEGKAVIERKRITAHGEREVDDGRLHLKAETTEREYGTLLSGPRNGVVWERSFALPRGVDLDAIDATLDAGVLTITLPLAAEVAPRRIAVRTNGN